MPPTSPDFYLPVENYLISFAKNADPWMALGHLIEMVPYFFCTVLSKSGVDSFNPDDLEFAKAYMTFVRGSFSKDNEESFLKHYLFVLRGYAPGAYVQIQNFQKMDLMDKLLASNTLSRTCSTVKEVLSKRKPKTFDYESLSKKQSMLILFASMYHQFIKMKAFPVNRHVDSYETFCNEAERVLRALNKFDRSGNQREARRIIPFIEVI